MKRFFFLSILIITTYSSTLTAQLAPIQWDELGVTVRQGDAIKWSKSYDSDQNGQVVFAWSDTRDGMRGIYAQKIDVQGSKLWEDRGVIITEGDYSKDSPAVVTAEDNQTIIVWRDYRSDHNHGDLYAQKLNGNGVPLWDQNGILVTTGDFYNTSAYIRLVSDGSGGVLIFWIDTREGNIQIFASRVESTGNIASGWPNDGLSISPTPGTSPYVEICSDNSGGAIAVWSAYDSTPEDLEIYGQRVSSDAQLLWNGGNPVTICDAPEYQSDPEICRDGSGGAFITWKDKRHDLEGDIYFHHIQADGSLSFPELNGRIVYADPGSDRREEDPRITADGYGNAIIAWIDFRNDPQNLESDIYAQKVNSSGDLLWDSDGIAVCTADEQQWQLEINSAGDGYALLTWCDDRDDNEFPLTNIYTQKISSTGDPLWQVDGIPVCTADYYQHNPVVIGTATQAIIGWGDQRSGSAGIYYQIVDNFGISQLTEDGAVLIDGISNDAKRIRLVDSGSGNTFVFYQDERNAQNGVKLFVQLIDTLGNLLYQEDGLPICPINEPGEDNPQEYVEACSDGQQGAFIVWEDGRFGGNSTRIYTQRINQNGDLLWDEAGVLLHQTDRPQYKPQIIETGEGDCIVVWSELTYSYDSKVMAARLTPDGTILWTLEIADAAYVDDVLDFTVPDGYGGAYIVYYQSLPYDYNLYLQKVDGAGVLVWENDVVLCEAPDTQQKSKAVTLSDQSIVVAWQDKRDSEDYLIYAQRVTPDGNILWQENGLAVSFQMSDQINLDMAVDNDYIYVVWEDFRNLDFLDIYLQKLDMDGSQCYSPAGINISQGDNYQSSPAILPDETGGNYVVWSHYTSNIENYDLYGIHMNSDGQIESPWLPGGNVICAALYSQMNAQLISDQAGGFIAAWEDGRSSDKAGVKNIYAQRVNEFLVGIKPNNPKISPSGYELFTAYPNPFNPTTTISFSLPEAQHVKLTVFNVNGQVVSTLVDGMRKAAQYEVSWDASQAASGLYFYKLEAGDFSSVKKMVLLK